MTAKAKEDGTLSQDIESNPLDQVILFSLEINMFGISKKVKRQEDKREQQRIDSEGKGSRMATVNKKILDCPEYRDIATAANDTRAFLKRKMVPGGSKIFKAGRYPIPIPMMEEVDEELQAFQSRFREAVQKFCTMYVLRTQESMKRLKQQVVLGQVHDLSDERDYPSVQRVREEFGFSYSMESFGPPDNLKGLNRALYQREMQKVKEACSEVQADMQQAMRVMFQDLLEHMVEKITPGEDGTQKVFRDSLVLNMKEFLDDFSARNITNDADLAEVVEKCKLVLKGKTAKKLRSSEELREETAKALNKIKTVVSGMVQNAPARKFTIEEDE